MARRGRPPSAVKNRAIELWLPVPLLMEVELYLPRDTLTGKVKHGAWSTYFSQLVREDLARKAQTQVQVQGAENVAN